MPESEAPGRVMYRYRLDSARPDSSWSPLTEQRTVTYPDLPAALDEPGELATLLSRA